MSNQGDKHDDREIDARSIIKMTTGLAVIIAASLAVAWVISDSLTREDKEAHPPPPAIAAAASTRPSDPRLQPEPKIDLETLRAEEQTKLHTYHWVDKNSGVVGIPIDRAIELVAERGLPSRVEAFPVNTATVPSQSSLGDMKKEGQP
jgi:hypothetical protein